MSQKPKNQKDKKTHQYLPPSKKTEEAVKESEERNEPINNTDFYTTKERIGEFIRDDNNQPKIANIISACMFTITLVLAVYTALLFYSTKGANKNSKDAVDVANKSLRHQVIKDSLDSISDEKKLVRDNAFIKKQSNGIDTQIKGFRVAQEEFEKENQSYLQIINFDTMKNYVNNHTITYYVSNISKQPAKIICGYTSTYMDYPAKNIKRIIKDFEKNSAKYANDGTYVIKEAPQKKSAINKNEVRKKAYEYVKDGTWSIYFFGTFIYKNLVSNKLRIYHFAFEINLANGTGYSSIYNDNKDFK